MTAAPSHAALVARAVRYLRDVKRCPVVLSEMACNWLEAPDAIGFTRPGFSLVIECKASRSDFGRDRHKPSRNPGVGMGLFRFYLTPANLIRPHEVDGWVTEEAARSSLFKSGATGWGLLWWDPVSDRISMKRPSARHEANQRAENLFLVSALARVQKRLTIPLHEYIRWETAPAARIGPTL